MTQTATWAIWLIAAATIAGIVLRPWRMPEALWAVLGASALLFSSLISTRDAAGAVGKGVDVYLFLIGMMVLSEFSRAEGLFDWLAAYAVRRSGGSPQRLFALVYGVGTVVTVFLSNDATAVVLTPAVYAATRKAGAPPLPYLLICAFVANAASFVLPISNPANLVIYGAHLPALPAWLAQYGVPSLAAIVLTFLVLRHTQRASLTGRLTAASAGPGLSSGGKLALAGIVATAATLLATSALGRPLGLPTAIAGGLTGLAIVLARHKGPWPILRQVSWSIVPLVAGLFVIARAIENTDVLQPLVRLLAAHAVDSPRASELVAGSAVALVSNLVNNLPLGLIASTLASGAHVTPGISGALLIGVDLGPNLSVTGSLATILWLSALRREGLDITPLKFLALGSMLMPPALLAALVSLGRFA